MLEIRPNCEHCGKDLPNTSTEAMICTFECTYCVSCAVDIFKDVCPNCSGNFEKRPIRPSKVLNKYPVSNLKIYEPKNLEKSKKLSDKFKNIPPVHR